MPPLVQEESGVLGACQGVDFRIRGVEEEDSGLLPVFSAAVCQCVQGLLEDFPGMEMSQDECGGGCQEGDPVQEEGEGWGRGGVGGRGGGG